MRILYFTLFYFSFVVSISAQTDFLLHATEAPELEWEERAGGMGYHLFTKMVTDSKNNTYVAGYHEGHTKYGIADYDVEVGKVGLVFMKLDTQGEVLWYKKSESDENFEQITTVAVDKNDNVFVLKKVNGTSYIIKYDSNGNKLFEKEVENGGIGMDMLIDDNGNIHIAFAIYERAVLVNKFDPKGDIIWSRRIETDHIYPRQLALNPNGNVYMICDFLTDYDYNLLIRDGINNNILRETESFSRSSYEDHNGIAITGFSSDGNILFFCKDIIRGGEYRYPIDSSIGMAFNPTTNELCIAGRYEDDDYKFLTVDAETGNQKEETLITNINPSSVNVPTLVDMQVKNGTIHLLSLSHDVFTYSFSDLSAKITHIFDKYGSNTQEFDSEFGSPAQKYFPDPDYYAIDEALEMAVYNDGKVILSVDGNSRTLQNNRVLLSGGSSKMAFIQVAPSGNINWAKDGDEFGLEVQMAETTDEEGNLYVLGFQRGNSTFGNNTLDYQTDLEGRVSPTLYIVKYDRFGNVVWVNQSDKSSRDYFSKIGRGIQSIEVFEGKIYCFGDFKDLTFSSHSPSFQSDCNYLRFDASNGRLEKMKQVIISTNEIENSTIKNGNIYLLNGSQLIKINQNANVEYDLKVGELVEGKIESEGIKVGNNGDIYFTFVVTTSDRNREEPLLFQMIGRQYSATGKSAFLAKANSQGNVQWVKDISEQGLCGAKFTLNPKTNETYMMVGDVDAPDGGINRIRTDKLAKFSSQGNKIWVRDYGFEETENFGSGFSFITDLRRGAFPTDYRWIKWENGHIYVRIGGKQAGGRNSLGIYVLPVFLKINSSDGSLVYQKYLSPKYPSSFSYAMVGVAGNHIYYLPHEHYRQVGSGDITISEFRLIKHGRVHKLQNQSAQIYDNYTEGATYQWYKNGTLLPNTERTITITSGGNYSVIKTVNGQILKSDTLIFEKFELVADIEQEDNGLICGGLGNTNLTAKKQPENTLYHWYIDGKLEETSRIPSFSGAKIGTHKYKLVVTKDGYSAADSVTITGVRSITPRIVGTNQLCEGQTATLEVTLSGITPVPSTIPTKIQWYRNGQLIAGENQHQIIVDKEGDYSATYTVGDCLYENTRNGVKRINVYTPPTIKIIQIGEDSLDITPNENISSVKWYRGSRLVKTLLGTTKYQVTRSGTYTAVAQYYGVCEVTSAEFVYEVPTTDDDDDDDNGDDDNDDDVLSNESIFQSQVLVYPNPTNDIFVIDLRDIVPTDKEIIITLTDVLGRELYRKSYLATETKHVIDITNYKVGIYGIQLIWDKQIQVRKKIHKK
ncbi:T9SS type A sorting domain-containing protein [Bernardetia sp. ABR2-2B]|uniref:T9SS type A sorting domain-containing protein n=1 Tax=Bernardetia sp. ABR2-2B TaxID=3127472 RepID=UPI0030CBF812